MMTMMMYHLIWKLMPMLTSIHTQKVIRKKTDAILKPIICTNQPLDKFKRMKVWPYHMVLPSFKVSCGKIILVSSQWISKAKKMLDWLIQLSLLTSKIKTLLLILLKARKHSFKRQKFFKMRTSAPSSNSWLSTKAMVLEKKQTEFLV